VGEHTDHGGKQIQQLIETSLAQASACTIQFYKIQAKAMNGFDITNNSFKVIISAVILWCLLARGRARDFSKQY